MTEVLQVFVWIALVYYAAAWVQFAIVGWFYELPRAIAGAWRGELSWAAAWRVSWQGLLMTALPAAIGRVWPAAERYVVRQVDFVFVILGGVALVGLLAGWRKVSRLREMIRANYQRRIAPYSRVGR